MIAFFVPGEPQGKGRARVGRVAGHARMFTPAKTVAYEGLIAMAAKEAMQGAAPLDGATAVRVVARHVVPASWSRKKREQAISGALHCVRKPDLDNVAKAIGDGCNGVLWRDDSQVVHWILSREWALQPGVLVEVWDPCSAT